MLVLVLFLFMCLLLLLFIRGGVVGVHFCRLQELEQLTGTEADDGEEDISMMVLPDYSSGNNERDIHVKNFNINVGGLELLDCADLKLAYGRKVCWCAGSDLLF